MKRRVLFAYTVTHDSGNAPCTWENGGRMTASSLLSLTCCKGGRFHNHNNTSVPNKAGGLRYYIGQFYQAHSTDTEIYLLGMYKDHNRYGILYLARDVKALPLTAYFSDEKYANRNDRIYEPDEAESLNAYYHVHHLPALKRRKNFNPLFHPVEDKDQHAKDLIGRYALLSEQFVYTGKRSEHFIVDPTELGMEKKRLSMFPSKPSEFDINAAAIQTDRIISAIDERYPGVFLSEKGIVLDKPHTILSFGCKGCYQK